LSSLHRISVHIFFLFLPLAASAGNPYNISCGATEAGMGSVSVVKPGFWSSFANQALLAENRSLLAGINYENRFFINELGTRTAAAVIPAGTTSLGIIWSHFGYTHFRRERAGIACGLPLSENINAGVQIDYYSEKTSGEYDNNQFVTFETGLTYRVTPNIIAGVHLFNPIPRLRRKSFLPSSIQAGAGIELSNVLFAGIEAEMSSGRSLVFRSGFEYKAGESFWLRGGFSTENTSFTFGLGYQVKSVRIDLSFATHERLGVTSGASLIFKIK
jgi:hypothetical protein